MQLVEQEQARGTSGYFGGPDQVNVGTPIDDERRLDIDTGDMTFRDTDKGNWDEESPTLYAFKQVAELVKELGKQLSEEERLSFYEMIRSGLDELSFR